LKKSVTVGLSLAVLTLGSTAIYANASPTSHVQPQATVHRSSDHKTLVVGDVVSQLAIGKQPNGSIGCLYTRAGTEIEVEAPPGDQTTVEESVDKNCQVIVAYIGPPRANSGSTGGVEVDSSIVVGG
jgi:hypothetical protein